MIDYERIMREWDEMRERIANGDKGSGPRDWFESILEEVTQQASTPDREPSVVLEGIDYNVNWVDAYTVSLTRCR